MTDSKFASLVCFILAAFALPAATQAERYPSTGTAWVIPGAWEAPTHRKTLRTLPDADAVEAWEIQHADVAFGGDYGLTGNLEIDAISYMYHQKLDFSPDEDEMWYRKRAVAAGRTYEDYFLHFTVDTELSVADPSDSTDTPYARIPDTVGWTADPLHAGYWLYQMPPWDAAVWEGADADGALYVLLFEKFDELTLTLSAFAQDGTLVVEYPSALDATGTVSAWSELTFTDGTVNLRENGVLRWTPPADWRLAKLHDGSGNSFGHGQFFGQTLLQDGMMYAVRLYWRGGDMANQPRLANVELRDWMPEATPGDPGVRIIPGWDPANDTDTNGYVDDVEFAARPNLQASARMRWESRTVPLGSMWSSRSDWCRSNLFSADLRSEIGQYLATVWTANELRGGYNDDLFKTVGSTEYTVVSGGAIAESVHAIDSDELLADYTEAFVQTFAEIASATGSSWLTANISAQNPFMDSNNHAFLAGVSAYLREDYFTASMGLSGYFGINKMWDIFAMSALDLRNIIQGSTRSGRVRLLANKKKNWLYDQESIVALYYLINVPGLTYLNAWNHTYQYGSNNTESWQYYRGGIPKNVAYQPGHLLQFDIGVPAGRIPDGYDPMQYMVTTTADGSYTILGDSTDTTLSHPELLPEGTVPVVPSYIFFLQRSADPPVVIGAPAEMVLARAYTNGLALYRTAFGGGDLDFMKSKSPKIVLPEGRYRRVKRKGNRVGRCTNKIRLRGYEGALLLRDSRCD